MKRRRSQSSIEPPTLRATRSNTLLNSTPEKRISKTRSITKELQVADLDDNEAPNARTKRSRLNRETSESSKYGETIRPRETPGNASIPLEEGDIITVETPKRKARKLVSPPSKKGRLENETPSRSNSKLRTPVKARTGLLPTELANRIDELTPVKKGMRGLAEEIADLEPQRIVTRGLQRNRLDGEMDDEESEEEEEDESEEEENDDQNETFGKVGGAQSASYENFFQHAAKKKKSLTSNNTLSLLPTLTFQESLTLISNIPDRHTAEIQKLHDAHRQQFTQWKFEVDNGYNILLFGYGSKRSLIEAFGREELVEEMPVLVVNGYIPSLSLDTILVQILQHIQAPVTGDKLHQIQSHLSEPLAILIHSLDSPVLRLPKNQQILSTLASNKYINIIASVDHVNAPLLFDSLKASRYNFLWHDCTTFVPYRTELSFEETTFLSGGTSATSSVGGLAGIKAVLNNLTSNARELYLLLLKHQLPLHSEGNEPAGQDQGITFPSLRQICAKKILPLANPTTLRNTLGEFFDHGLIVRNDGRGNVAGRKGKGGGEVLWAPFGKVVVREVIEFLGGDIEA